MSDEEKDEAADVSVAKARQLGISNAIIAVGGTWACVPSGSSFCLLQLPSNPSSAADASMMQKLEVSLPATCACFDGTGTRLLVGGDDKTVRLWDTLPPGETPARTWVHNKKIGCVAFSPDGDIVMWSDLFGEVFSVSLSAGAAAAPAILLGHLSPISHLAFHPTDAALLSADREGHVRESQWPLAYIIECYYLEHQSPIVIMLPLATSPLVLTAATDGKMLCAWRVHAADTPPLSMQSAAELVPADASVVVPSSSAAASSSSAEPESASALACGCEVPWMRLVALGARGSSTIHFCEPHADATAGTGGVTPKPELACRLPAGAPGPIALACSAATRVLCALLVGGEGVALLPAASSGVGFNAAGAAVLRLAPSVPESIGAAAGADEEEERASKAPKVAS